MNLVAATRVSRRSSFYLSMDALLFIDPHVPVT